MKPKFPEGMLTFDLPITRVYKLPKHLAWFFGSRISGLSPDEIRVGNTGTLRPFTTLEVWLAMGGVFVSRRKTARYLDSRNRLINIPQRLWANYALLNYPLLTSLGVPKLLSCRESLGAWLKEAGIKPPAHIFSFTASFVAEELPTAETTSLNPPATHARS